MLISIFYVVLLAGILSTANADPWNEQDNNIVMSLAKTTVNDKKYGIMNVLFLVESYKDIDFQDNVKRIELATKRINKIFWDLHPTRIQINIEGIHEFKNTGKPLGDYNAKELKMLLKNDALFNEKITTRTDYTLVLGYGTPQDDKLIAVTRFQSICSRKARGITIVREDDATVIKHLPFHIAKRLTYNLVCAAGLYDKAKCVRGFREQDLASCKRGHWPSKDLRRSTLMSRGYCFLGELGMYFPEDFWKKNRKICYRNRSIRRENRRRRKLLATENEKDEGGVKMIVYVIFAISGVVLLLAALLGAWLWNRKKSNKLKKQLSVKYKYNSMKRDDAPSVIRDPTVTNDLE